LENITTLVLAAFTFNFQVSQYKYIALRADWNSAAVWKKLYCAFIDYRKAFDSVDRILLWQKLLRTSIDGNMLIVIQNMYKNAKSCVRDGSNCSDVFHQILV
jgi:hypothetical protein